MSFDTLALQPADPLLKIIGAFRRDTRADKIDLGVGVFRDDDGNTPVMRAVKLAEDLAANPAGIPIVRSIIPNDMLQRLESNEQPLTERQNG